MTTRPSNHRQPENSDCSFAECIRHRRTRRCSADGQAHVFQEEVLGHECLTVGEENGRVGEQKRMEESTARSLGDTVRVQRIIVEMRS